MPFYDVKCSCGHEEKDVQQGFDEYKDCIKCGKLMQRVLGNYSVIRDIEPYLDTNMGHDPVVVKSKKHRQQLMKERGLTEKFGKGWY